MPKLPDPTPEQTAALERVRATATERDDTERRYIADIYAAADLGLTATQIAPYVNRKYQTVQSILKNRTQ